MAIEDIGGATLITGKGIDLFRLLSIKGRIELEGKGLKSRINTTAYAMREFGIPGKATAKNRAKVLAAIEKRLDELKQVVALENAAKTGQNN